MDGENHGTLYEQMDDLGVKKTYFWVDTHLFVFPNSFSGLGVLTSSLGVGDSDISYNIWFFSKQLGW